MEKYILVVDDSQTIRTTVEFGLKSLGHPVRQAEDGEIALEIIKEIKNNGNDLAVVICDINMPQMDGMTFIQEFRKDDKFTPIIVLTTETESGKIQKAKESGVAGWVVKPFQPEEFLKIVSKYVK